jgi:uncharacterized cofD-like protein
MSAERTKVVALGGGHGLHAALSALRRLDVDVTAVVTVADDGGSSGRLRRELAILPPGDLRMALAALATGTLGEGADALPWVDVLQHRMGGSGALAGHPIGNLALAGLMELRDDPVAALADLGALVGAVGRVLPMSAEPLDLVAEVDTVDPDDPVRIRRIRGQSSIAATPGRVRRIEVVPKDAPACGEALAALAAADFVILGPGSWFTSVIPHLLVAELREALCRMTARLLVLLNLEPQVGETDGFSPEEHLRVLTQYCPDLPIAFVIADSAAVPSTERLERAVHELDAQLIVQPVAADTGGARHDATKLSIAISAAFAARGMGGADGSTESGVT